MAILSALQETTVHPTADWVYAKLKPRYPNLSLGTVYRNLKKFCETGKAVSVGVINGQEHFDGRVEPHAHFVCKRCGAVLDVPRSFSSPRSWWSSPTGSTSSWKTPGCPLKACAPSARKGFPAKLQFAYPLFTLY